MSKQTEQTPEDKLIAQLQKLGYQCVSVSIEVVASLRKSNTQRHG